MVASVAAALLHVASIVGMLRGRGSGHTWGRLVVASVAAATVSAYGNWAVKAAAILHVAALAAVAPWPSGFYACSDPTPGMYAAEFSVLAVTLSLLGDRWFQAIVYVWCGAEGVAITAALVRTEIPDKASHLTWWMLGSLAAYDFTQVADVLCGTSTVDAAHPFLLVLSLVVMVGVLFMSVAQCSLLERALDDSGAALYIVGNFAMHYYPVLRALAGIRPRRVKRLYRVAELKAAAVVTIYAVAYDPVDEYGCSNTPDSAWAPLILSAVAIAVTLAVPTAP